jgi:hypothetical protein
MQGSQSPMRPAGRRVRPHRVTVRSFGRCTDRTADGQEVSQVTCPHSPACPDHNRDDATAAVIVADHCEQGWYRLCNGLILFDDGGCLRRTEPAAA